MTNKSGICLDNLRLAVPAKSSSLRKGARFPSAGVEKPERCTAARQPDHCPGACDVLMLTERGDEAVGPEGVNRLNAHL